MSAALGSRPSLYSTAVGKKYVMAISGMVLMGFVFAHMVGNLKMYLGADGRSTTTASSCARCSCRSCRAEALLWAPADRADRRRHPRTSTPPTS